MFLEATGWAPLRATSDGGTPGPGDDFWYSPALGNYAVTPETAMRQAAVYAATNILAQDVGSLPLVLYRRKKEGGRERAPDHPLYTLLHDAPNQTQHSMGWRETEMVPLVLQGDCFSERIYGRRNALLELRPLPIGACTIEKLPTGRWRLKVRDAQGGERTLIQDEVFRVPGLSLDGVTTVSPIGLQRETLRRAKSMQDYQGRFYENDATPSSGVIEHPSGFKNPKEKQDFRESMQANQTGAHRHKLMVLTNGMKYTPIAMKNTDAQFIEAMKYSVTDVARIFRIPPHMLADLERATFSNIEHQSLAYVIYTLRPWLVRWEQAIQQQLLFDDPEYFAEFLVDGLLRGDLKSRYEAHQSAILAGWKNRNEIRETENLNPAEDLDEFLQPVNMQPAGTEPQSSQTNPGGPGGAGVPPAGNARVPAAMLTFVRDAALRALNREKQALATAARRNAASPSGWSEAVAKHYMEHVGYLQDVLHIPEAAAQKYCAAQQATVAANGFPAVERWNDEHVEHLTQLAIEAA